MTLEITDDEFEELVGRALDRIPEQFLEVLDNCLIVIEEESPAGVPTRLGLYEGVALTSRDYYAGAVPDVITLYQKPLVRTSRTKAELEHEVYVTVVHEIGHYFGLDDDRLHELDWG